MSVTRDEVQQAVIGSIRGVLPNATVDDATDPIRNLGLDSDDGVGCACDLEERLGITIPDHLNPFVDDSPPTKRSRNVRQIVDWVCAFIEKSGRHSNG